MAIYHFSAQVASRSAGRSAVAMAAYRSGERLTDERTGELKHYKREAKPETVILAPGAVSRMGTGSEPAMERGREGREAQGRAAVPRN